MTNLIARGRQTGKTHDLIITSHITGIPIVCYNQVQVQNIKDMAKNMGYEIPEPFTYTNYTKTRSTVAQHDILIDNLEFFLEDMLDQYFKTHVVAATISVGDK